MIFHFKVYAYIKHRCQNSKGGNHEQTFVNTEKSSILGTFNFVFEIFYTNHLYFWLLSNTVWLLDITSY